jgi:hypothetical protein
VRIQNCTLLSIGYDFLARKSEILILQDADIQFLTDGAIWGTIRKSKADQFGRGQLKAKLRTSQFRAKKEGLGALHGYSVPLIVTTASIDPYATEASKR